MTSIPILASWNDLLPLKPNSLLVLDIDETFLCFPSITEQWWNELLRSLLSQYGHDTAQRLAREEWTRVVNSEPPVQTDTEGFQTLNQAIRDTNSTLIFLTARLESFAPLTRKHLAQCGVSADVEVHYSTAKGETLRQIAARHPHSSNVICVDDKLSNLFDVLYHNPRAMVYQWVHELKI